MSWNSGPLVPDTIEDYIDILSRKVGTLQALSGGIGRTPWNDAVLGPGFSEVAPFAPGWRVTNDGRIELRGRVRKSSALVAGDIAMLLPWRCSPPANRQGRRSSVTMVAPTDHANGGIGSIRAAAQLEGLNTVVAPDVFRTLRVCIHLYPSSASMTGWVAFDGVTYEPHLYLDALPPVPAGEDPMVEEHGIAVIQHGNGDIQEFPPGVQH